MGRSLHESKRTDPSQTAQKLLDYVLDDSSPETVAHKKSQAAVSDVLNEGRILEFTSQRQQSRILFITEDVSVLDVDSAAAQHFLSLQDQFAEIHICVCADMKSAQKKVRRFAPTIWAYALPTKSSHKPLSVIEQFASSQLEFTDGFRPDVLVALNPFFAAEAGLLLSEKYHRPFQVHITQDIPSLLSSDKKDIKKKIKIMRHVLPHVDSVRVSTKRLHDSITEQFPQIVDVEILPRHQDIRSLLHAKKTSALSARYPQYVFFILFVGELTHDSQLFRALDAARTILTSPKVAMVIMGEGPLKEKAQERAELLGIEKQIIFENDMSLLHSYLTSADILLSPDIDEKSDEVVLQAAAAGLPLLIARNAVRNDLFVDEESALLCDQEDTVMFGKKLHAFMNQNALRRTLSLNAHNVIQDRLHEDPDMYKRSYRDSIEIVFQIDKHT